MNAARERLGLGLAFLVMPGLIYALAIRPSTHRLAALQQRIQKANEVCRELPPFTRVSQDEKALLEDPAAPWRGRIARVGDDAALLAHVDRVVSDLNAAMKAAGVRITTLRATLEPVAADCTLPRSLAEGSAAASALGDAPEFEVGGWVLEVELAGPPGELFKALAAVPRVHPLLEPVGLRWQLTQGEPSGPAGQRQQLLLRNLYLKS
jgi:hypothetical protein